VPVTSAELCERLETILTLNFADDTSAWVLTAEGPWERVPTIDGISVQGRLAELARDRSRRWRAAEPAPGSAPPGWVG
ncbi:MAG TPA: hypothetical protein VGS21_10135, partial [Acidimicrobiales bacterium]|nr:hypothetical protein [Acidimicrobiales bacterium]